MRSASRIDGRLGLIVPLGFDPLSRTQAPFSASLSFSQTRGGTRTERNQVSDHLFWLGTRQTVSSEAEDVRPKNPISTRGRGNSLPGIKRRRAGSEVQLKKPESLAGVEVRLRVTCCWRPDRPGSHYRFCQLGPFRNRQCPCESLTTRHRFAKPDGLPVFAKRTHFEVLG